MLRNASTIIIYYTDKNNKKKVLLTKRKQELFFLGGFHVYPGGKVDNRDHDINLINRIKPDILSKISTQSEIKDKNLLGAHIIAGIREVFEEVGLKLFSMNKEGNIEEIRQQLIRKEQNFNDIIEHYDIFFDFEMDYLEHFITPNIFPVRFDTLFFIHKLNNEAKIDININEIESYIWISPEDALEKNEKFDIYIIPPTKITLSKLLSI